MSPHTRVSRPHPDAVLWFISQVLEFLQWDARTARPHYQVYVVAQEILWS